MFPLHHIFPGLKPQLSPAAPYSPVDFSLFSGGQAGDSKTEATALLLKAETHLQAGCACDFAFLGDTTINIHKPTINIYKWDLVEMCDWKMSLF